MIHRLLALLLPALACAGAIAQNHIFIEVDLGRRAGDQPVVNRAVLTLPAAPTDTALLYFRGNPGYMLLRSVADRQRNLGWVGKGEAHLLESGIALVLVDCPTDQWGDKPSPPATNCLGDYRSSPTHADDVRRVMARLREQHRLTHLYVMGHSIGSISSRWLSINLGRDEVAGIIHSATMNSNSQQLRYLLANLLTDFPRRAAGMPMLHVHNENDACRSTPHHEVRRYARDNLVSVRGGIAEGDPCGGGHLHSYQGIEEPVIRAIVAWILTRKVGDVDASAKRG